MINLTLTLFVSKNTKEQLRDIDTSNLQHKQLTSNIFLSNKKDENYTEEIKVIIETEN